MTRSLKGLDSLQWLSTSFAASRGNDYILKKNDSKI